MIKSNLNRFSVVVLLAFLLLAHNSFGQALTGIYTLPGTVNGNTVNTLTQLSALLGSNTVTGTAVFEFTSSYTSTDETYPIIFTAFSGTGDVIIRPAASVGSPLTTSGSPASSGLVILSGVKNLTFDGRPGGAGSTIEWQFENTANEGSYPAFQLMNGAQYDALKYLTIEGSGTNTTGTINLSTSSTTGNSYDTIAYCNITSYSGYPYIQIYSAGSASYLNSNNSILNNNISNFQAYNGSFAPTQGGIIITSTGNGSNWNISGNSIYCTGAPYVYSAPIGAISFNPGNASTGNVISGNYIGGKQPLCGGAAMKIVSNEANGYPDFDGIYSNAANVIISNNTIQNIYMGSKYGSSTFCGINIAGTGTATISSNVIGSATDTNNIVSGINGTMLGIWNQNTGTVTINANTIANLTTNYRAFANDTSSQTPGAITGIYDYGGGNGNPNIGATTVTNNQIFNLSTASNYNNNLYFYINSGSGILGGAQDNNYSNVLCGIYMEQDNTSSNTQIISKNIVYGLNSTVTGGTDISYINGIIALGNTGGTNIINANLVYGFYAPATYGTSGTYFIGLNGIYLPTDHASGKYFVQDNIVDLGYRSTDASSVTNAQIFGIWENNSDANNTNLKEYIYHNSVFIGGSDNTSVNSYAFARDLDYSSTEYDSMTIMNNIFVNDRTTTGTGYEYGLYLNSTIDIQSDYNDVYGTSAHFYYGAANGSNYNTKAAFQISNTGFESHSISADPQYASPATATPNLHISNLPSTSPIDQAGTAAYTIVYDFDSLIRANYSPVDIGATIDCSGSSPVSVTLAVSQDTVCSGTSVTFTATPTNGGTPVYNFYLDGVSVQNGSSNAYTNSALNNSDSIKVEITSNAPCASVDTAFSNSITVTVNSTSIIPAVGLNATQTTICAGSSVTFTATPTNGGSAPVYKFYKNGVLEQNSVSNSYATTTLNNNDSVWVVLYSNAACVSPDSAKSAAIAITVSPSVTPIVSVSPSQNNVCAGTLVTFQATYTNGGAAPTFDFYVNGTSVQNGAGTFYSSSSLNNNDSVWVVITSNANCATTTTVTSAKVHMIINSTGAPTVTLGASQNSICAGMQVTFTANPTNGGTSPIYNFYLDGTSVQNSTSNTYTSGSLNNGDTLKVVITSNATCVTVDTAKSNTVTMIVNSAITPTISITAGANNFCSGTSVTFTTTSTGGGASPTYNFYVDGTSVQNSTASTYTSTTLHNNDSVWVVLNSNAACASPASVPSGKVHMQVTASVVPSVTLNASQNILCAGTQVNFTAGGANGGTSPTYDFYLDGTSVQNGATTTYSNSALNNNDSVWVVITSNATCASPASVKSNTAHLTVGTATAPTVSVTPSQNNVCSGTDIIFTANPTNGGNAPQYDFYVNGSSVQNGAQASYSSASLNNNDSVWVVLTSDASCASPSTATSAKVYVIISPSVTPAVALSTNTSSVCTGETVSLTANATGGGGTPNYDFYLNGTSVQNGTANTWNSNTLTNGAIVKVLLTSSLTCSVPTTAIDSIVITVHPLGASGQTGSICSGSGYSFYGRTLTTVGTYYDTLSTIYGCDSIITLQLSSSSNVATQLVDSVCSGDTYNFNGRYVTNAGVYYDTLHAAGGCDSVITLILLVTNKPSASVYQVGKDSLLTTAFVSYQWLLNDTSINGATNEFYLATRNGRYEVVVTNGSGCTDTSAAFNFVTTGINDLTGNTAIQLSPNPTSGELNIRLDGLATGVLNVKLYDLQGQVIASSNLASSGNNTFTFNISNCAAGLYYLQLQAGDWTEVRKVEVVK